ncbi:hypothetical protein RAB80_014638 [Fusarium oxysporum f. sp. vasinfectum]|nr:hypothetical protein RAB80_014638 [Fusarium oxysporum f. sp. vasinfectum]
MTPALAEAADEDADSALEVPLSESLASLRSSIFAYQEENGRTYHAMSAGNLQHHVMTLTIEGRHCLCPKNDGAARVLDLGTGTGIWAIEYADAHPEAEVIGVDLSPGQPTFVPPNCSFEIDDLEKEWTWSKTFDFIFCRMTTGSFADNFNIVENAFNQLQPGGYFEAQDIGPLRCDDGTLSETSDLWRWMTLIQEGLEKLGRSTTAAEERKSTMEAVGFEAVVETVYKLPTNHWPRDKKYKDLGGGTGAPNARTGLVEGGGAGAAYINRRVPRASVKTYLDDFRESDKKEDSLLSKDAGVVRRDETVSNSVVTTWEIIFEQIRRERPSAANLLAFMSFFNPSPHSA